MLAFEVSLNGKVLYVAALTDGITLQTNVSAFALPMTARHIAVTTAIPSSPEGPAEALWWGRHALSVGDTVSVRIIEVDKTDPPQRMSEATAALRASTAT